MPQDQAQARHPAYRAYHLSGWILLRRDIIQRVPQRGSDYVLKKKKKIYNIPPKVARTNSTSNGLTMTLMPFILVPPSVEMEVEPIRNSISSSNALATNWIAAIFFLRTASHAALWYPMLFWFCNHVPSSLKGVVWRSGYDGGHVSRRYETVRY